MSSVRIGTLVASIYNYGVFYVGKYYNCTIFSYVTVVRLDNVFKIM